jgi:predicted nuclease of predicted toxin-antitoxin system
MKIAVDENIPTLTMSTLRTMGHDVLDIRGTSLQGISDEELWDLAQRENRLFVTTDKGFSGRRGEKHHGILIVRLKKPNEQRIHERVLTAFNQFSENEWPGLLVVMRDVVQSVSRI